MPPFTIVSSFTPQGDQPQAIKKLSRSIERADKHQMLLGVTGSGKTFTMANVIDQVQKPTLVIAHNKTLAAQLYGEFKEFFPENAVEYFVSYYDYYQPEAYIPRPTPTSPKDSSINDTIDKLRHSATRSLFERRDVIIVASVSCIYGLGSPEAYQTCWFCSRGRRRFPGTTWSRKGWWRSSMNAMITISAGAPSGYGVTWLKSFRPMRRTGLSGLSSSVIPWTVFRRLIRCPERS